MSSIVTQTCDGYTITLQIEILSVEKGGEKESEKKVTQRKEKEKDPERENASLASQLARIAEAWNTLPLKKIARFTGQRKERVKALLALYPEEEIIRAIYSISRSRFLLGGGARRWQVRFDWFILPENFSKVREGNYLDEEPPESETARLQYSERELQHISQVWPGNSPQDGGGKRL